MGLPWGLYFGAARAVSWDRNSIAEVVFQPSQVEKLAGGNKAVP
jgi:hypothetical protein